jgi:Ankyrin repeat
MFPDVVKDNNSIIGWYPLHIACKYKQSENVVLMLIDLFFDAVNHKSIINDCYTLHTACQNFQSEAVVLKWIDS